MRKMLILVVLGLCSVCTGGTTVQCVRDPNRPGRPIPDPYSGIYCLYAAMRLSGLSVEMTDLVKPEYIPSKWGSSIQDLNKAAQDHGMYAAAVENWTCGRLRRADYRVVLGVKSDAHLLNYDHYELFLGTDKAKARLFNPPDELRTVDFAELSTQWDGGGLIVSANPVDIKELSASSHPYLLAYAIAGGLIILIVYLAKRRKTGPVSYN